MLTVIPKIPAPVDRDVFDFYRRMARLGLARQRRDLISLATVNGVPVYDSLENSDVESRQFT